MSLFRRGACAACFLLLVVAAAPRGEGAKAARPAAIPRRVTVYELEMIGKTYDGFYRFERAGALLIEPRLRANGFRNGRNLREVGLFSGSPPSSPSTGSIWFTTNTTMYRQVGLGSWAQGLAALDVAFVRGNNRRGELNVTVDGAFWGRQAARTSQINCFNATSGLAAGIYQIIEGEIQLGFSSDGSEVAGAAELIGTGYIEPARVSYSVLFHGVRTQASGAALSAAELQDHRIDLGER